MQMTSVNRPKVDDIGAIQKNMFFFLSIFKHDAGWFVRQCRVLYTKVKIEQKILFTTDIYMMTTINKCI